MAHEKVEFRLNGYTLIDEIELDYDPDTESGTAYIDYIIGAVHGSPTIMFTFSDWWQLVDMCLLLLHKSRYELNDYVSFMRHDLTSVWSFHTPFY